ncbi:MAG: M23 family metallopeptidase [bacterium]
MKRQNIIYKSTKIIVYILIATFLVMNNLDARATNLDQILNSKTNYKKNIDIKKVKYDTIFINQINQQGKNRVNLNKVSIDIEKLLFEKSEKIMTEESASLGKFLKDIKFEKMITSSFIYPLTGTLTSGFGLREHPVFKIRDFHSGIDISAPPFSLIIASNDGKVLFTGKKNGYGNMIIINHGNLRGSNITSIYGHLSEILVSNNQIIKKGQLIGVEGTTGTTTGPHLHFEIRNNGTPVNPLLFIK